MMNSLFICARRFRSWLLVLLSVAVGATISPSALRADEPLCQIAESGIMDASSIRGLKIKKPVQCVVRTREQIKGFLFSTIDEKIPSAKLAGEASVYRALGLTAPDFHYKEGIVSLYLSQIGGYYDPEEKHFVMASWMPGIMQTTVAVHEMTHALQDQYFDLQKIVTPASQNSDEQLAHSALVEGDATAVMMDYTRRLQGLPPLAQEKSVEGVMLQNVLGLTVMGGAGDIPNSLKLILVFPYTSGLRFAHTLLQRGGYRAVDDAFRRLPRSTEEILHPEKYLSGRMDFVELRQEQRPAGLPAEYKLVFDDTLGEFVISALLSMHVSGGRAAIDASSGWGGDRVWLYQSPSNDAQLVVWKSHWDTEKDAREFFDLFGPIVKKQAALFPSAAIPSITPGATINGADVTVTITVPKEPTAAPAANVTAAPAPSPAV